MNEIRQAAGGAVGADERPVRAGSGREASPGRAGPRAVLHLQTDRHRTRAALEGQGWRAAELAPRPDTGSFAAVPDPDVVLLGIEQGEEGDRLLGLAESYRRRKGEAAIVAWLSAGSEAQARWVARLTPYCYPRSLSADCLASFVDRIPRASHGPHATLEAPEPQAEAVAEVSPRRVAIRLWESVEVDGRQLLLGAAERNFLHALARSRGERLSKDEAVDAGAGRLVAARECRRRLGRRLGEELAGLLVPTERGEPYRFREPAEVEAECRAEPRRHPPTELRILGRSSVRTVYVGSLRD